MTTSRWRNRARRTIQDVINRNPGLDDGSLLQEIDRHYPFGERRYLPYRMWLEERAKAFERSSDPAMHVCDACGAGLRKPCRPIGDDDELTGNLMVYNDAVRSFNVTAAKELVKTIYHESRLPPALRGHPAAHDTLPIFSWSKS